MKKIFLFSSILAIGLVSCKKDFGDKKDCGKKKHFEKMECGDCENTNYEDFYTVAEGVTQYEVEPIVVDPTCNCIVSGLVKYVENGLTVAMVDYGKGECDAWAVKKLCVDGKCEGELVSCCKFEQVCPSLEGPK